MGWARIDSEMMNSIRARPTPAEEIRCPERQIGIPEIHHDLGSSFRDSETGRYR